MRLRPLWSTCIIYARFAIKCHQVHVNHSLFTLGLSWTFCEYSPLSKLFSWHCGVTCGRLSRLVLSHRSHQSAVVFRWVLRNLPGVDRWVAFQSKNRKIEPQPAGATADGEDPSEAQLNVLGKYVLKVVSAFVSHVPVTAAWTAVTTCCTCRVYLSVTVVLCSSMFWFNFSGCLVLWLCRLSFVLILCRLFFYSLLCVLCFWLSA